MSIDSHVTESYTSSHASPLYHHKQQTARNTRTQEGVQVRSTSWGP